MRPKLALIERPCKQAVDILEEIFDITECRGDSLVDAYWTGLTPAKTARPVFCPCTGVDHVSSPDIIYLDEEWKRNEGRLITSTAEHTWSLILQLAKLKRMQLRDKALGIIGYGRIGSQVYEYAKAFKLNIIVCDRMDLIKDYELTYKYLLLYKRLFKESDIITLHVPLNESTKGMIGKPEFDLMKPGALLINTSRAKIVDDDALMDALENKLGGYADDFYMNHVVDITEHPNVILTNHIGGNCIEAREATDIYIAKKAVEYWRLKNP